jgi:hypothetical protein
MANAVHMVKEVKRLDYNYQDYDHFKWVNYPAWKVLRNCAKFCPPSPPSTTMNQESDNTSPETYSISMIAAEESNANYNQSKSISCSFHHCFDNKFLFLGGCEFCRRW